MIIFSKIKAEFNKNVTTKYVFNLYFPKTKLFLPKINLLSSKKRNTNPDINKVTPSIHKYDVDFLFDVEPKNYFEKFQLKTDAPLNLKINRKITFNYKKNINFKNNFHKYYINYLDNNYLNQFFKFQFNYNSYLNLLFWRPLINKLSYIGKLFKNIKN